MTYITESSTVVTMAITTTHTTGLAITHMLTTHTQLFMTIPRHTLTPCYPQRSPVILIHKIYKIKTVISMVSCLLERLLALSLAQSSDSYSCFSFASCVVIWADLGHLHNTLCAICLQVTQTPRWPICLMGQIFWTIPVKLSLQPENEFFSSINDKSCYNKFGLI